MNSKWAEPKNHSHFTAQNKLQNPSFYSPNPTPNIFSADCDRKMTLISFACIKSFKEHSNQSHWRHRWSCNPKLEKKLNVFETVSPATKIFIRNLKKQLVCLTFHFYKQIFKNLHFFKPIIFVPCFIEKEPSI